MSRPPASSPSDALLVPAPAGPARRLVNLGIAACLLLQIVVPGTYYIANELTSERFSWRMFSSVHMSEWDCLVSETLQQNGRRVDRIVPLQGILQESTVNCLKAGQLDVVNKFLEWRCAQPGVQQVRYEARGIAPSGAPIPPIRLAIDRGTRVIQRIDSSQ